MKTRTEVKQELQNIVITDRQKWKANAWDKAIDAALRALSDSRPLTGDAVIRLDTKTRIYPVPECCIEYIGSDWGMEPQIQPHEAGFPGALPRVYMTNSPACKRLEFSFIPRQRHLNAYGSEFSYQYKMLHVLTDEDNTILPENEDLFFTRALAELMKMAMAANVTDPITLHKGMGNVPNEAQPTKAYDALMQAYRDMI